jgi:hypothetical protein
VEKAEPSREARVLERLPEIRAAANESPDFRQWLTSLRMVQVDGETLYLRGGDILRDREQVLFEWARRAGLLSDEAIRRALA